MEESKITIKLGGLYGLEESLAKLKIGKAMESSMIGVVDSIRDTAEKIDAIRRVHMYDPWLSERMLETIDDAELYQFTKNLEAQMAKRSPFTKGREGAKAASGSGGRFISLKDGDAVVFAPLTGLDGMVSSNMHEHWDVNPAPIYPCIGPNCPGCGMGHDPRWKGYLPVYTKEGEFMIFPFTTRTYNKLETLEDEMDDRSLKGRAIKVRRTGTGFDTEYTPVLLGRNVDVGEVEQPDWIDWLGPTTEEDIIELLNERGIDVDFSEPADEELADAFEREESDDDAWGDV